MDLTTFQGQGGGSSRSSMSLPSAPGELPSGPGQGRGYGRRSRGNYSARGGDRPSSRADEASQWRRNSRRDPSRREGGYNNSSRRDSYNDRRDDTGDRPQHQSKYEGEFSRSQFGSKKQSGPTRIGAPRDSFGSSTSRVRNNRTTNEDDGRTLDRSQFGRQRGSQIRTPNRTGGSSYSRRDDYNTAGFSSRRSKPSEFDGSGSGFAHHLVAEFFTDGSSDSTGSERRVNYDFDRAAKPAASSRFSRADERSVPRDRNSPWGSSTRAVKTKSPEETAAEEADRAAKEEAARQAKAAKDEERRLAREAKEAEKKRKADEKAAREAEEARLERLMEDFGNMFDSGVATAITLEHINDALPDLSLNRDKAEIIGTSLGMTINQNVISLQESIHFIPKSHFDIILISMLSSLYARMGEMNFIDEIKSNQIDVLELMQDKASAEKKLVKAGLKCLVSDNEAESKLDEAFAKHVSLSELNTIVQSVEDFPTEFLSKICDYIFTEYFTNQNPEDPAAFLDNGEIFLFLERKFNSQVQIIDAAVRAWFDNGRNPEYIIPMFDRLLRQEYLIAEEMTNWVNDFDGGMTKMETLFTEVAEDETFNDWCMTVEENYVIEEEEEEEEDDE